MSRDASRIDGLRQQLAQLNHYLDNWPAHLARTHQLKRKTRANAEIVERILRELTGWLIAGAPA